MSGGKSGRTFSRFWQLGAASAAGATLFALGRWYLQPPRRVEERSSGEPAGSLIDLFLPESEFNGQVSVVIHAPPDVIFQALREVTLADMPLAKWIGELRYLPARLAGKMQEETQGSEPFMQLVLSGGTILLAEEPDRELVVGSVGKYHNLADQQFAPLASPEEFVRFDHPDYQKLAMSFRVTGNDPVTGYRLTLEHRTHALSPAARWKFAFYWLGIKPGGNFVSWLMLRAIRRRAEAMVVQAVARDSVPGD